jgi:hypothetical protein
MLESCSELERDDEWSQEAVSQLCSCSIVITALLHIPELQGVAIKKPDSCSNPLLKRNRTI